MDDQKKQALDFMRCHRYGIISTVTPTGKPEAAAIEYGTTDDLEVVFDTFTTYRKYTNILANPYIAFVVFSESATIQYEGKAREISEGSELHDLKSVFFSQVPEAQRFDGLRNTRFFKVKPSWVRYRDYSQDAEPLFEMRF